MAQTIFKRTEKKYLVTQEQCAAFQAVLTRHMKPDRFGEYLVQNLYFDTDRWDIIRASIEKPLYKEKLRLRCYDALQPDSKMYLELKKKYKGVVYKRRISFPAHALAGRTVREVVAAQDSQMAREIAFYMRANAVQEKIYIAYRRLAFAGVEEPGLRVTVDADVRFRLAPLNYTYPGQGYGILPEGKLLMEIKTLGAMPLWMARALCENGIFPTSFSKYGTCYTNYILQQQLTEGKVLASA